MLEKRCLCLSVLWSPFASLWLSHSSPCSVATAQMFIWLCQAELRGADLAEVRMGIQSLWRVHLFNLETFSTMFRLGRCSKCLTPVLDDPFVGEIHLCIAVTETEIPGSLPPNYAFLVELADWQITLIGLVWTTQNGRDPSGFLRCDHEVECMTW